jgi:hypothetical protein
MNIADQVATRVNQIFTLGIYITQYHVIDVPTGAYVYALRSDYYRWINKMIVLW